MVDEPFVLGMFLCDFLRCIRSYISDARTSETLGAIPALRSGLQYKDCADGRQAGVRSTMVRLILLFESSSGAWYYSSWAIASTQFTHESRA